MIAGVKDHPGKSAARGRRVTIDLIALRLPDRACACYVGRTVPERNSFRITSAANPSNGSQNRQ